MANMRSALGVLVCAALVVAAPDLLPGDPHHHGGHHNGDHHSGNGQPQAPETVFQVLTQAASSSVDYGAGIQVTPRPVDQVGHYNPFLPSYEIDGQAPARTDQTPINFVSQSVTDQTQPQFVDGQPQQQFVGGQPQQQFVGGQPQQQFVDGQSQQQFVGGQPQQQFVGGQPQQQFVDGQPQQQFVGGQPQQQFVDGQSQQQFVGGQPQQQFVGGQPQQQFVGGQPQQQFVGGQPQQQIVNGQPQVVYVSRPFIPIRPEDLNTNPGIGESGQKDVVRVQCGAGLICVPENQCDRYTGFVKGALEPVKDPSLPTVAIQRCSLAGGTGFCCQQRPRPINQLPQGTFQNGQYYSGYQNPGSSPIPQNTPDYSANPFFG